MAAIIKRSRRYQRAAEKATQDFLPLEQGIEKLKSFDTTKFDSTVELIVSLGIDAKQADQAVRGSLSLPHGVGKTRRVIAFVPEHLQTTALNAGAIKAGGQELVQEVETTGFTDFDVAISTPDMMRFVGRLGKVLGPKGLMPSPKAGTVTPDVGSAVKEYVAGKIEFRNDAGGNIHAAVGKVSFPNENLAENVTALLNQLRKMKPQSSKGAFFRKVVIKGTMTPAVYLSIQA